MVSSGREDRGRSHNEPKAANPNRTAVRVAAALTVALLAIAAVEVILVARAVQGGWYGPFAVDFDLYTGYAQSWLRGEGFYLPVQLAGPYVVEDVSANVYPPVLLYLAVPFTVLPALLWWVVPIGIVTATIWRVRPAWWAWPLLAFILVYPRTWTILVTGNPAMWSIAFGVAGIVWGWPAIGAALKLTFLPLAFLGANRRSWWIALVIALVACIPFGSLWLEYVIVLGNAVSSRGFGYIAGEWPIALGLVAIVASGRATPHSMATSPDRVGATGEPVPFPRLAEG